MTEHIHIDIFLVLLMVTAAVAMAVKWVRLPYSISLVIVGLLIGVFHLLPTVEMTPDLILLVFLPALLFEASWNIDLKELHESWLAILLLAVPGVVISTAVIAAVMHFTVAMPWTIAFLLGAMLSATDPISVLALFRKLGMNKRLTIILEGESLFNDGTAVVLFKLILAMIIANTSQVSFLHASGSFTLVVLGGAILGAALGYIASRITAFFDDHLLEITLTTILAYGSYLAAELTHVSPVISVVCAGIVMGNYGSRTGMSATTRLAVNSFWEYAAFLVNSFVFLLIGMQVKFNLLEKYSMSIAAAIFAIIIARAFVVYGLSPIFARPKTPVPWKWRHLLWWGALRGSLCMALALSLPSGVEFREVILITTFGVVLFTLLVPGLSIEPLVQLMKMNQVVESSLLAYKELKGVQITNARAMDFLHGLRKQGAITQPAFEKLEAEIEQSAAQTRSAIDELHIADASIQALEFREAKRQILEVKKDCLTTLGREGLLDQDSLEKLKLEIDQEINTLSGPV